LKKACLLLLALILIPSISQAEFKTHAHTVRQLVGWGQSQDDIQVAAIHKDDNQTIPSNSNLADAYYNRGNDYIDLGQYIKAIKSYDQAIHLNPNLTDAFYNRGNAYSYLGKHQRAMVDYSQVIRLNPNYDQAYNNRGLTYLALRQFEHACSDFQKACKLENCKALSWTQEKSICQ
jgi:tetratricopeptide (TPR) repeat protein